MINQQENHKLGWTDEQKANFIALRNAVSNCPKLFFINDEWEIGLVGGFPFQTVSPGGLTIT